MNIIFDFDDDKNRMLFETRGVTFQNVIDSIKEKGILADFQHPNKKKYPNQRIIVVEIENYTYCVPYVEDGDVIILKTIFPNRKFMYLLEGK
jgi:uncharacterized DUF497 family protein